MKRSRTTKTAPKVARRIRSTAAPLQQVPSKTLQVLVTGGDGNCELGLGPKTTQVKRPRVNKFLGEKSIVKVAAGAMHCLAIDKDGELWSWGQNDGGALGRPTPKVEAEDSDDDEDEVMNRNESTPGKIDTPANVQFVDIAATDNLSVAITTDGKVWGWGTFINDSTHEFFQGIQHQNEPYQLPSVRGIVKVAAGANHVLLLDKDSKVWAWGTGNADQLGARLRESLHTIVYGPFKIPGLRNIVDIAAGDYQSFAIDRTGKAFAWGLNNFGQCAVYDEDLIGDGAKISKPLQLELPPIKAVASGAKFSLFVTEDNKLLSVGENNFNQLGVKEVPNAVRDSAGRAQYTLEPVHVTKAHEDKAKGSQEVDEIDLPPITHVACGADHALAVDSDGAVYTWGIGETYQLGHGVGEDESLPRKIWNSATEDEEFIYVGAGGQFSIMAAYAS